MCTPWIVLCHRLVGTYCRALLNWACYFGNLFHNIPAYTVGAIIREGDMMGLRSWSLFQRSWNKERASALPFLVPGQYMTVKLKQMNNSTHLAWWGFRDLASWLYCRFLWSAITWNGHQAPSNQCLHFSSAFFIESSSWLPTS